MGSAGLILGCVEEDEEEEFVEEGRLKTARRSLLLVVDDGLGSLALVSV